MNLKKPIKQIITASCSILIFFSFSVIAVTIPGNQMVYALSIKNNSDIGLDCTYSYPGSKNTQLSLSKGGSSGNQVAIYKLRFLPQNPKFTMECLPQVDAAKNQIVTCSINNQNISQKGIAKSNLCGYSPGQGKGPLIHKYQLVLDVNTDNTTLTATFEKR